jgi:hypothetical protein
MQYSYLQLVTLERTTYLIIAVVLSMVCLVSSSIVNFSPGDGMYGGDSVSYFNSEFFLAAPHIYNGAVDISMGYTPFKHALVLYCTYEVTDSGHKTIDSSLMLHVPLCSEYIISKTLTNLANGNYTLTVNAYLANGTVHVPLNETFTVDSTFQEPKLTVISPQNQNYNTGDIDVTFNVNSNLIWAYYRLDSSGQDDWTRCYGNMTLQGLAEGTHTLVISVKTEANEHSRNANSAETVVFTISK